jgi:hypothetical protein
MDPQRFDGLAIILAGGGRSRRAALQALGAALLATAAGAAGLGAAAGKGCAAKGKSCQRDGECCSDTCRKGECAACPNGKKACGHGCVRTDRDPKHCGGCGRRCVAGQQCVDGACRCNGAGCAGCCAGDECKPGTTKAFCGAGGGACQACAAGQVCIGGACVPECNPCRVFVTSTQHAGNLGGLAGADAICQARAAAAGLPGTYLAWLSDATQSPATRFPTQSAGEYRLVNGTKVADGWADLTSGDLDAPINVTETGGAVGGPPGAWTNTQPNGTVAVPDSQSTCSNWTTDPFDSLARVGSTFFSDARWSALGDIGCVNESHLFCFQQS